MEPLVTLGEQRSGRLLGWERVEGKGAVFFANNMAALQRGVVKVGDAVAVTALRDGPFVPLAAS